jgi:alanine-glyoxylate transaminase/serine-glyoxylate transaminase/serine-pyruvate transaminase
LTQLADFRKVADELGALLVVDTVASLAAVPLHVDNERVDICFSGTQKAISAPPGMSPRCCAREKRKCKAGISI